jgi:hypothetical protein
VIQWFSVDSENLSIQCDLSFSELYLEISWTVGTVIRPVRLLIQEGWLGSVRMYFYVMTLTFGMKFYTATFLLI